MKRIVMIILSLMFISTALQAQRTRGDIHGEVYNIEENAIVEAIVKIRELNEITQTDQQGKFSFNNVARGRYHLEIIKPGFAKEVLHIELRYEKEVKLIAILVKENERLDDVEVFGERNSKPKGLESITRMPLRPSDQIQSISIISDKVIKDQGALTLTEAMRNVPGVTLFGSYGGVKESMSARGFRGVPVLKNGVRIDGQLQTASGVVDMQGVESLQMIKGSAAVTQGVITDIGNAGGVINVVTKSPNFRNFADAGLRVGSWGQVRPVFDLETILDKRKTVSFRINGAYERADSYRKYIQSNRVYINPSLAWQPTERTKVVAEGDFLNDNRTPHTSAVNLHPSQSVNALYLLPYNQFVGFDTDNNNTKLSSFMLRIEHKLTDKFSVRTAYASSLYYVDNLSTSAKLLPSANADYHSFSRTRSRSLRNDKNKTFQFDLIGQNVYTGKIKHTLQAGFDYRIADVITTNFTGTLAPTTAGIAFGAKSKNSSVIDTVNVFNNFSNQMSGVIYTDDNGNPQTGKAITFVNSGEVPAYYSTFGILAQDVIEFNKYLKLSLGLRYSEIMTKSFTSDNNTKGYAWNPSVGVIVTPIENINVFGSYTNATNLRSQANLMSNGEKIGPSSTEQFEGGIKSDWLDNRLRFNFTYFHIYTANLANAEYVPGTNQATGYYFKAGDLVRDGIETELNGRIRNNFTVMLGYAFLHARYTNSPSYVEGSAPMNAPKHTANGWIKYDFISGALKNLSLSFGAYYVGTRPVNEYSLAPDGHGNLGGEEPFDMPAYTTLNAQIGYRWKNWDAKVYLNNLADEIGYNSYFRGGFINQTEPRNFAASLAYRF